MKLRTALILIYIACFAGFAAGLLMYERFVVPPEALKAIEYQPAFEFPTLQSITVGARTDNEAYQLVADYYFQHRSELAPILQEPNEQRARALYAMLLINISHPFAIPDYVADTFLNYIRLQTVTHCSYQPTWQRGISERLGLNARLTSGTFGHAWLEVQIDGKWETFDASSNTWVSEGSEALASGAPRVYRSFPNTQPETYHVRRALVNYGLDLSDFIRGGA